MNKLMTVQELADYLQVTTKTVYRFLERGGIPAVRVGHLWRFDKDEIDTWLRQNSLTAVANIIVIDDDDTVCSLFKEVLEETGYSIDTVQDPYKGLELIINNKYDMVFLDLMIPQMNGVELYKQIRAVQPDLPVTIITGYPDSDLMESALEYGPFGVMKKPFTSSDILTATTNYLRFSRPGKNR